MRRPRSATASSSSLSDSNSSMASSSSSNNEGFDQDDRDQDQDEDEGEDGDDESLDPGIRRACRQALSCEYFPHPARNVMNVSKSLKIGHMEMMYLRAVLGKTMTDVVLIAFGLLLNGVQNMSPLETEYRCPGLPAIGRFPARECTANGDYLISMAGRYIEGHPLYGVYCCQICIRSLARREYEKLSTTTEESLNEAETERLNELQRQLHDHRNHTRVNRTDGNENKGVRSMNRVTQSKRVRATTNHESESQKSSKKSGENRAKDNGSTRPQMIDPIKSKLVEALQLFTSRLGQQKIWWNSLVGLLDMVLIQEAPKFGVPLTYTSRDTKVFYHEPLYRGAAKDAGLERQGRHYIVSGFVEGTTPSGEKMAVLYEQVMESLK
mmetsp:Transcript_31602/g.76641  ORF Transcript_31602/g.76641 Transcript_31602/m.76641 type:complete len:381 (+) Transcript_31602:112-1254(+)